MARTLLFLSADSFHATVWQGGKLGPSQFFSNDANGRERFSAWLGKTRHPAYMLVDVIEEDFRMEVVPHLVGSARRDLLARKFEQYYRNTPFRQASLLQRQKEGRRDDEMLFSALTNPQRITPWLDILLVNRIPLAGIYSLPNISAPLIKDIPSDHVLLLTWEKDAGLRQTYFNAKRLHFSRLIPVNDSSTFSESVSTETPRTQQYLKSLSLPPPGETLDVYIICHTKDRPGLQSHLEANSELRYTFLDIHEVGKRFKTRDQYADSDATPLLLHLLAAHPPSAQYANSEHTHFSWLWQLRRILFVLAAMITLGGAVWSGLSFWQGEEFAKETDPLLSQKESFHLQTQQIQSSFATNTVPAADMKTAVLLSRQLTNYSQSPDTVLRDLTIVLNNFANVEVNKVSWKASAADAGTSPYPAQVITLDGSLTGFGSNYRTALDYLDRFQQALTQRGYTVSTQRTPLDLSSKASLSAETGIKVGGAAEFTLQIIWRKTE